MLSPNLFRRKRFNREDAKTRIDMEKAQYENLVKQVFQAALEVHKTLGSGLLESVYEYALIEQRHISKEGSFVL